MRHHTSILPRAMIPTAVLALVLSCLSMSAMGCASGSPAQDVANPARIDRYAQVFDRGGDEGLLVARFLKLDNSRASVPEKAGDSTILVSPEGRIMLIDAGAAGCADQVVAALKALGVKRIDAVVVSHPHYDHIGGMPAVFREFEVGTVYSSRLQYSSDRNTEFLESARREGVDFVYLEEGSRFMFGDRVSVTVYNPEPDIVYLDGYPDNSTQFVNNRSLVMKFVYGKGSMLFTGDAYTARELELVKKYGSALKADVIKVGHHGSATSSAKSFVRAVAPRVAVAIHDAVPSLSVYRYFLKTGAAFITFVDGCVKVSLDAEGGLETLAQFDRSGEFPD